MTGQPIMFTWDGEAMAPASQFWSRRADKQFVIGERYELIEADKPRSSNSHRHYFAAVKEAWANLPELMAERFPTPDHLRKYALIKAGFHNSNSIVAASAAEALRLAAFIKPMDDFALVTTAGAVVTVYTAKSQSYRMGKEEFQRSKEAVLGILADMIGVTPKTLAKAEAA